MAEDDHRRSRPAFTLVELLVVLGVLAILAGILFPVFAKARARSLEAACTSNLRQIGQAFGMYLADFDQVRPPRLHDLSPDYISDPALFVCDADRHAQADGGWAWLVCGDSITPPEQWRFAVSYGHFWFPPPFDATNWRQAQTYEARPGYAVCVTHGVLQDRRQGQHIYCGKVLRLCFDGSVYAFINQPPEGRSCLNRWYLMTGRRERRPPPVP